MNATLAWIAPDLATLEKWTARLTKSCASYGIRVESGEVVRITEQSETIHDRVEPYQGFGVEIKLKIGEMDWRDLLKLINQVEPAYRLSFNG